MREQLRVRALERSLCDAFIFSKWRPFAAGHFFTTCNRVRTVQKQRWTFKRVTLYVHARASAPVDVEDHKDYLVSVQNGSLQVIVHVGVHVTYWYCSP